MSALDLIYNHKILGNLTRETCEENRLAVDIAPRLLQNGFLDHSRMVILKPDAFYNTKDFATPPRAIGCLIIVVCKTGETDLYLIELRSDKNAVHSAPKVIMPKFRTIIEDFAPHFPDVFDPKILKPRSLNMWLIGDASHCRDANEEIMRKKIKRRVYSQYYNEPPLTFLGLTTQVIPIPPYRNLKRAPIEPCPASFEFLRPYTMGRREAQE